MDTQVKATIARLIEDAQQDDASDKRSKLFDRYMGEPYGDEQKGRSAFISTDVSDAIEAILPDIMDVFTSAEDIVEFAPVGPEDEQAAKQETEAVSHIFWQKNEGFTNLYVWIKEALIQQNSYIKRGWQDQQRVEIEEYAELTPDELMQILSEKEGTEYEILEAEGFDPDTYALDVNEMGMPEPISIKLRCVTKEKRYVIECIPQEEFFHTPRWGRLSLDGIPCCGHRRRMEVGELRAMGFDDDSIDEATDDDDLTEQKDGRFDTQDVFEDDTDTGDDSTKMVMVYEAYCRLDINDDGMAELVRVWASGDGSNILRKDGKEAIEEVSCCPFSALTPYLVPHRHIGRAVAELVDDIQKVKTVLMRHTLDNLYLTNYARPSYNENEAGEHLANDLANPAPGAPIRTGGAMVEWQMPPAVIGTTMPMIQMMDDVKETRTGATRYNQGLDANSLNKTATGIQQIMNASQKKTKLIARTIAETGLRDLFLGIHRDLRAGPMRELVLKLTGQWVAVNPRTWKDRTDMTVKVGMGTGDRDIVRQGLMMMGQIQQQLMAGGSRMVDEPKLYATAQKLMGTFGFKSVEPFLNNPTMMPPPPPAQPDPQLQMAQAQLQMAQKELDSRIALDAQRAQWAHEERMMELQVRAQAEQRQAIKTAADITNAGEKLDLDRQRAANDDDFKRDKLEVDAATGVMRSQAKSVTSEPAVAYDKP
jgi:hypothetical protein